MTRATQVRRFRGNSPLKGELLTEIEHGGVTWHLWLLGAGAGLWNLKLVAKGWVKGRANYWLQWNGARIVSRSDGLKLPERDPQLAWRVKEFLQQVSIRVEGKAKRFTRPAKSVSPDLPQPLSGVVSSTEKWRSGGVVTPAKTCATTPILPLGKGLVARFGGSQPDAGFDGSDLV